MSRKFRPLTSAERGRAESSWRVALRVAARHAELFPRLREEFVSAFSETVCRAAMDFDPARGASWGTYLRLRLDGAARDVMRAAGPQGFRRKDGAPDTANFGDLLPDADFGASIPDEAPPVGAEVESADMIDALMRALPESYSRLMRPHYTEAAMLPIGAVASLAGVSVSYVDKVKASSIAMLREHAAIRRAEIFGVA